MTHDLCVNCNRWANRAPHEGIIMNNTLTQDAIELDDLVTEDLSFVPTYVPTIEETFTASGAHRQIV